MMQENPPKCKFFVDHYKKNRNPLQSLMLQRIFSASLPQNVHRRGYIYVYFVCLTIHTAAVVYVCVLLAYGFPHFPLQCECCVSECGMDHRFEAVPALR